MFGRRLQRSLPRKVLACIWPDGGWMRAFRYLVARASRVEGNAQRVAGGFAIGGAVSFTPLVGAHFVISAAIAKLTGRSVIAAIFGTMVGNPISFPFIWSGSYLLGAYIIRGLAGGMPGDEETPQFSTSMLFDMIVGIWDGETSAAALDTFLAMLLGGTIMGLLALPVLYWIVLPQAERIKVGARSAMHGAVRSRIHQS